MQEGQQPAPAPGSGNTRRLAVGIILAAVFGFAVLVGYGLARGGGAGGAEDAPAAADFELALLDGGTFRLSEERGNVVVVNFWASWCPPCREETPGLQRVWQQYRDRGVTFVGVAVDDTEGDARGFIEDFGVTYRNGLDEGSRVGRAYRTVGVPETFVVDAEGRVSDHFLGPVTERKLAAALDEALARGR